MALHHVQPAEKTRLPSVSDPTAKTAALVKADGFEAVHLDIREKVQLAAGDWLYLERGQEHSVAAVEDSALHVTILFD